MVNQEIIDAIRTLIQVNEDRIQGYESAMKESKEADLKSNFFRFIQSSRRSKTQLVRVLVQSGAAPVREFRQNGRFYGMLRNLKAAIRGRDRLSIFRCWENVEDLVAEMYERISQYEGFDGSSDYAGIIGSQRSVLEADRNKVRVFRETLTEEN
jgi:uncharacterized protein (TIGR02284 family)